MPGRLRTGCSSWTSEAWWGSVYPTDLPAGERLSVYARSFDTVEVDSSYYRDPGSSLVRRWARATPPGFVFTMKFPRDLLDPKKGPEREAIAAFEGHARELGPKLGALLLQFPPWAKPSRAGAFLQELLPILDPSLRYAVELRDSGWFQGETAAALYRQLRDLGISLAWSYLTYVDVPPDRTSDWVYLRFIGDHDTIPEEEHGSIVMDRSGPMRLWAGRIREAAPQLRNGFAFFNNHFAGYAPESAEEFRSMLGGSGPPGGPRLD